MRQTRRAYLAATAGALTLGTAGCLGGDDESENTATGTETGTSTESDIVADIGCDVSKRDAVRLRLLRVNAIARSSRRTGRMPSTNAVSTGRPLFS